MGHLHGVGARKHIYGQYGGVFAVDGTFGIIALSFERYACHIAQAYERAVGVGPYDYLLEFSHRRQASACGDGYGYVQILYRLLSEHTGCRFAVLVLECFLNIGHGKPHVGQFVRLYPYLHGIVTAAYV